MNESYSMQKKKNKSIILPMYASQT